MQQSGPGSGTIADGPMCRHAVDQLLVALQDKNTGVALEAEAGLAAWAASDVLAAEAMLSMDSGALSVGSEQTCGQSIIKLAGSADSTVRMRLLSMLVAAAGRGGHSVAAVVKHSGGYSLV